jgi:hypothetical protein
MHSVIHCRDDYEIIGLRIYSGIVMIDQAAHDLLLGAVT